MEYAELHCESFYSALYLCDMKRKIFIYSINL